MKKTICLLFLLTATIFAQTEKQKSELLRIAEERTRAWKLEHGEAESLARSMGLPIRQVLPDGSVISLQRFEDGLPMVYATDNLNAARTISTNRVWSGGGYGYALSGLGQILRIWDGGGILTTHQELNTRVTQIDAPSALSDHSTHVSGTMIATGVNASAHGMSNQATLRAFDYDNDGGEMISEAAGGMRVSNHSYGYITGWRYGYINPNRWTWFGNTAVSPTIDYYFGFYDAQARDWDQMAFDAPNYLICKSAGNDRGEGPTSQPILHDHSNGSTATDTHELDGGTTGYECIAHASLSKNILSVGAVNDIPGGYSGPGSVVASSFHGLGPTDDGRIKPDIVANGVNLFSSITTSNTAYGNLSGTSMSSPNVSGSVGLLLEHEKNLHGTNSWRSSTYKGLIIHTADEAGAANGPDYVFGWGLMNTLRAIMVMTADSASGGFNIRENVLSQNDTIEFQVENLGSQSLRATICWIDPPGTPRPPSLDPPNIMLVNDLDLRILNGATTYSPWVLNRSNPSADATTGDNIRDNVEQVHIASPTPGIYTIRVTHKGTLSGGSQNVSIFMTGGTPLSEGEIHGVAFHDVDGDAIQDVNENGLENWKIKLFRQGLPWDSVLTTITGDYSFTNLITGTYQVTYEPNSEWKKTYPAVVDSHTVSIVAGTDTSGLDFGLFKYGTVSGIKFHDLNDNSSYDGGDPLLPGWKIYLTGSATDSMVTDAQGQYEFHSLFVGSYVIAEEARPNWRQTLPLGPGTYSFVVDSSGQIFSQKDFGNFSQRTISGTKFNDLNGNGTQNLGEPPISGWMIYAVGSVNDSSLTDAQGNYILDGLGIGSYVVSEQQQNGWVQTLPAANGSHAVTFNGGEESVSGKDFGNFRLASISGTKYDDQNEDGIRDGVDTPIENWTIYLYKNAILFDSALTNGTGSYAFTGLLAGSYRVCEEPRAGWIQTLPPSCYDITILSGDIITEKDFLNYELGSITGTVYNDRNNSGTNDNDPIIPIPWKVVLQGLSVGPDTMTIDVNGTYLFPNLHADMYTVSQILESGWTDTYRNGAPHTVSMTSGKDSSGIDFGNFLAASIDSFRTATAHEWATSLDSKGKSKAEKRKADKVDFKFFLVAPAQSNYLKLKFSMVNDGKISRGTAKADTLRFWIQDKEMTYTNPLIHANDTFQVDGRGIKGKAVKVSYEWGTSPRPTKGTVSSFLLNVPRLPMPNLHNAGEDLYKLNTFPTGLLVGIPQGSKGGNSVIHPKYKDVQKSFFKNPLEHTGAPRCLAKFINSKPIDTQQKSLPPSKHSNKLFAEVLALKLNVAASEHGVFPVGLGDLIYDDTSDASNQFNGQTISEIVLKSDSILSCLVIASKDTTDIIANLNDVVVKLNLAFHGPMDTLGFSTGTIMKGVKSLYSVLYLRMPYGSAPHSTPLWSHEIIDVPEDFELRQNYPNPFNPVTTISFVLSCESIVSLKVYNVLGQEVANLLDREALDEGEQTVEFNGANLPSGMYFYKLTTETSNDDGLVQSSQSVKKMIMLK